MPPESFLHVSDKVQHCYTRSLVPPAHGDVVDRNVKAWGLTDDDEEDGFEFGGGFARFEMRLGWVEDLRGN